MDLSVVSAEEVSAAAQGAATKSVQTASKSVRSTGEAVADAVVAEMSIAAAAPRSPPPPPPPR